MERALGSNTFVTRMRADLPRDALRVDLLLQASDAGPLSNIVRVQNDVNFDEGAGSSSGPLREASSLPLVVLALLIGALGVRVRRRLL